MQDDSVERVPAATRKAITGPLPSAAETEPSDKPFEYRPSIVSYFDILGMKTLLGDAGSDAGKVAEILQTTRRFSRPDIDAEEEFGWTFVNFSDLVLRTVPILSEVNLKHRLGVVYYELSDLADIQVNLASKNVLIRGAVTLGDITVDRDLVFGPALATAYLLESKRAIFPRIIVDQLVLQGLKKLPVLRAHDYKQEMAYIRRLIRRDVDGNWFVDYLRYALDNSDDYSQYGKFILHHRSLVLRQLSESGALDGRTREGRNRRAKAAWLRSYHNRHVRILSAIRLKQETGINRAELVV